MLPIGCEDRLSVCLKSICGEYENFIKRILTWKYWETMQTTTKHTSIGNAYRDLETMLAPRKKSNALLHSTLLIQEDNVSLLERQLTVHCLGIHAHIYTVLPLELSICIEA